MLSIGYFAIKSTASYNFLWWDILCLRRTLESICLGLVEGLRVCHPLTSVSADTPVWLVMGVVTELSFQQVQNRYKVTGIPKAVRKKKSSH